MATVPRLVLRHMNGMYEINGTVDFPDVPAAIFINGRMLKLALATPRMILYREEQPNVGMENNAS